MCKIKRLNIQINSVLSAFQLLQSIWFISWLHFMNAMRIPVYIPTCYYCIKYSFLLIIHIYFTEFFLCKINDFEQNTLVLRDVQKLKYCVRKLIIACLADEIRNNDVCSYYFETFIEAICSSRWRKKSSRK